MDILSMLRTLGALGMVLGMLAGALWAVRRYDIKLPGRISATGRRRVELVERLAVDSKRSIALIRRDGCEHLILIGPEGHATIETGIAPPPPAEPAPVAAPEAAGPAPAHRFEADVKAVANSVGKIVEQTAVASRLGFAELVERSAALSRAGIAELVERAAPVRRKAMVAMPAVAELAPPPEPSAFPQLAAKPQRTRTRRPRDTARWNRRAVREALDA